MENSLIAGGLAFLHLYQVFTCIIVVEDVYILTF